MFRFANSRAKPKQTDNSVKNKEHLRKQRENYQLKKMPDSLKELLKKLDDK